MGTDVRINIQIVFEQRFKMQQKKVYSKIDVFPGDEADVAMDPAGYTG